MAVEDRKGADRPADRPPQDSAPEERPAGAVDRELDIAAMPPEGAREYVLAYITAWKRLQKEIGVLEEQILLWEGRVKAARERSEPQLASSTQGRVEGLKAELEKRRREEADLSRKVAILKKKLKSLQARPGLSVDPQVLLAQLQLLTGERDETADALRAQEAQAALEELKRKLQG